MKIIISPSKTMEKGESIFKVTKPLFIDKTNELYNTVKDLEISDIEKYFKVSNDIANITKLYFDNYNKELFQSITSYTGVQYKALDIKNIHNLEYINNNLFILSAFYGLVKPSDMISLYRYDFLNNPYDGNLYNFWNDLIYKELFKENDIVLNLASSEYYHMIKPYIKDDDKLIDFIFYTRKNNKLKEVSVTVKKARGLMVNFLANNNIDNINDIKRFNDLGFIYDDKLSSDNLFVFIKDE